MEDSTAILFAMGMFAVGFGIMFWQNIYLRARVLRQFFKQQVIIVTALIDDGRTLKTFMVNPNGQQITIGNYIWLFDKSFLRRQEIVTNEKGEIELKLQKEKGFKIIDKSLKYEEGVPVLFVDYETFLPRPMGISILKPKEGGVTPLAFGTAIVELVNNLRAKAIAGFVNDFKTLKDYTTYALIGLAIILVICGYGVYSEMNHSNDVQMQLRYITEHCTINLTNSTNKTAISNIPASGIIQPTGDIKGRSG